MEPLTLKLILVSVMLLLTLIFGLLPIKVLKYLRKRAAKRGGTAESSGLGGRADSVGGSQQDIEFDGGSGGSRWPSLTLCLLSCFTGGVFLGTCFLHLLPEVNEHLTTIKATFHWHSHYPIGELISCCGFFLIFLVEEVVVTMLQGGHGHSHAPIISSKRAFHVHSTGVLRGKAKDEIELRVRSITLVLALSFHSVIEGLAFGIAQTNSEVATLFLSVIIHKVIVTFSVGLQLARTHAHQLVLVFTSICILACMSPIGCAIGIGVEQSALNNEIKELVMVIFEGMAVGTFLYVTFFEVFIHERDNEHPNMLKLLVIIMGFGIVAGLRTMEHSHATSTDPTQTPSPFPVSPQSFNFSSTITTPTSVT